MNILWNREHPKFEESDYMKNEERTPAPPLREEVEEQEMLIAGEALAGNVVKENFHRGVLTGIRIAEAALAQPAVEPLQEAVERAFPSNWVDKSLECLGKPPWGCPDIERLVATIKKDVLAALAQPAVSGCKKSNGWVAVWEKKAEENTAKWGQQDLRTLGLAIAEEAGEIAQAILQYHHGGGNREHIREEVDDLGALLLQLRGSIKYLLPPPAPKEG